VKLPERAHRRPPLDDHTTPEVCTEPGCGAQPLFKSSSTDMGAQGPALPARPHPSSTTPRPTRSLRPPGTISPPELGKSPLVAAEGCGKRYRPRLVCVVGRRRSRLARPAVAGAPAGTTETPRRANGLFGLPASVPQLIGLPPRLDRRVGRVAVTTAPDQSRSIRRPTDKNGRHLAGQ
jgi:hypothetical protein